jgi:hypothetical protein
LGLAATRSLFSWASIPRALVLSISVLAQPVAAGDPCSDGDVDPSALTPADIDRCMEFMGALLGVEAAETASGITRSRFAFPVAPVPGAGLPGLAGSHQPLAELLDLSSVLGIEPLPDSTAMPAVSGLPGPQDLREPPLRLGFQAQGSHGVNVVGVSDRVQFGLEAYSGRTFDTDAEERAAFFDTRQVDYGTTLALTGRWEMVPGISLGTTFTTPPLGADKDYSYGEDFLGSLSKFYAYTQGRMHFDAVNGALGLDQLSVVHAWNSSLADLGVSMPWIRPHTQAKAMTIGSASLGDWRLDLFDMRLDEWEDNARLVGGNLVWAAGGRGALAASYVKVLDSDELWTIRKGIEAYAIRADIVPLDALPGLSVAGEYVLLRGRGEIFDRFDASAWSLRASYSAWELPTQPTFTYRYSRMSGETDYFGESWNDFDGLFLGQNNYQDGHYNGNFSSFAMELYGNREIHEVGIELSPTPETFLTARYFRFALAEDDVFGSYPVKHLGDELNLMFGWYGASGASLSLWYDVVREGEGYEDFYGYSPYGSLYHSFGLQFAAQF